MNFYIDFEATQFSDRIISIGCMAENGETFATLVKPPKGDKISKFITELTGITPDMIKDAPEADEAFNDFFDFVLLNTDLRAPAFFCYGDCDAEFIKATIRKMTDVRAITFARSILPSLFDYSKSVKEFFHVDQPPALRKLYSFMVKEVIVQKHDALEDAKMLEAVACKMSTICEPEDWETIKNIPGQAKPKSQKEKRKAPDKFINMHGPTWETDTGANEYTYKIKCYTKAGKKVKYFDEIDTAILWLIKYIVGGSPKQLSKLKHQEKKILEAIYTGHKYCGLYWKESEE